MRTSKHFFPSLKHLESALIDGKALSFTAMEMAFICFGPPQIAPYECVVPVSTDPCSTRRSSSPQLVSLNNYLFRFLWTDDYTAYTLI